MNDTVVARNIALKLAPNYFRPPVFMFAIFLFWVWARYIQFGARGGGLLEAIRVEFLIGGILIIFAFWVVMVAPLEVRRSRKVIIGIVLLFFAIIIKIPFAAAPQLAKDIFVDRVVKFAFLTFFIAVFVRSPRALHWFLVVWMVSIFWVSQEAVRGLISGSLYWQNQGVMRLHGAVPIYAHPNSLGGVAMGALPFVVYLFPVWRRWWQRFALLALLTVALVCVVFSGSRTAYVALLAFLLYLFVRSDNKKRFLAVLLITAPIIFLILPDQYIERFQSIGGSEAEGQSQEKRKEILADAWKVLLKHPGGVGVGCFPVVRNQMFGRHQDTHNLYLEVATNLGVQGLAVFAFFIWSMMAGLFAVHRYYRMLLSRVDLLRLNVVEIAQRGEPARLKRDLRFLVAITDATAGFIFIRLVLGLFGMDLYEVYWWFGAGITIALLELADPVSRRFSSLMGIGSTKNQLRSR